VNGELRATLNGEPLTLHSRGGETFKVLAGLPIFGPECDWLAFHCEEKPDFAQEPRIVIEDGTSTISACLPPLHIAMDATRQLLGSASMPAGATTPLSVDQRPWALHPKLPAPTPNRRRLEAPRRRRSGR